MRSVYPRLRLLAQASLFDDQEAADAILSGHLAHAEEYLARIARELRADGLRVEAAALSGEPAEAILQVAVSKQANFIAMATHGRGGLARLAHGSVAGRVLGAAHCPLLLVRGLEAVAVAERMQEPLPIAVS